LGHNHIGTEHILLGLVRDGDGVAARILRDLDADAETVRKEVIRTLSGAEPLRTWESRVARWPLDASWLQGLNQVFDDLSSEIRRELGREPDVGDLLLVLACIRERLAGRALQ